MKKVGYCRLSMHKIVTLMFILIISVGWMTAIAQTKKVVLKDFTFYPFVNQKSVDSPLMLPYESSSSSIAITIEECEDFEKVEDFLKYFVSPVNKSIRVESVNGLSYGWVVENNEEEENSYILTGMIKHNSIDAKLIVKMYYAANSLASGRNSLTMFRSFRPNQFGTVKPVTTNKPATKPAATNPATDNSANNSLNIPAVLAAHNIYRSEVGVPSLTWSAELATYAQAWADELVKNRNCQLRHRPQDSNDRWNLIYGENIFSGSSGYTMIDAVKDWGSEKNMFDTKSRKCIGEWSTCGHYTQIIWKKTTQVGCAIAKCANGMIIMVCNYNPPGNMNREPAY